MKHPSAPGAGRAGSPRDVKGDGRSGLRRVFVAAPCAVVLACAPAVDVDAEREALLDADRAFAAATRERGVEGWVSFFASDGLQFPDGRPMLRGPEQIREFMAAVFSDPANSLEWEPAFADVSRSGDLGYTYGTAVGRFVTPAGDTLVSHSRYVTIWRKAASGAWRVAADIGNAAPDPISDEQPGAQ